MEPFVQGPRTVLMKDCLQKRSEKSFKENDIYLMHEKDSSSNQFAIIKKEANNVKRHTPDVKKL